MTVPDTVLNKKLYLKIKNELKSKIKDRRWGVYDSIRLIKEYKKQGGKYSPEKKHFGTDRWLEEKWIDACAYPKVIRSCGRKSQDEPLRYCRPLYRISSKTPKTVKEISPEELKRRCEAKKRNPSKIIR